MQNRNKSIQRENDQPGFSQRHTDFQHSNSIRSSYLTTFPPVNSPIDCLVSTHNQAPEIPPKNSRNENNTQFLNSSFLSPTSSPSHHKLLTARVEPISANDSLNHPQKTPNTTKQQWQTPNQSFDTNTLSLSISDQFPDTPPPPPSISFPFSLSIPHTNSSYLPPRLSPHHNHSPPLHQYPSISLPPLPSNDPSNLSDLPHANPHLTKPHQFPSHFPDSPHLEASFYDDDSDGDHEVQTVLPNQSSVHPPHPTHNRISSQHEYSNSFHRMSSLPLSFRPLTLNYPVEPNLTSLPPHHPSQFSRQPVAPIPATLNSLLHPATHETSSFFRQSAHIGAPNPCSSSESLIQSHQHVFNPNMFSQAVLRLQSSPPNSLMVNESKTQIVISPPIISPVCSFYVPQTMSPQQYHSKSQSSQPLIDLTQTTQNDSGHGNDGETTMNPISTLTSNQILPQQPQTLKDHLRVPSIPLPLTPVEVEMVKQLELTNRSIQDSQSKPNYPSLSPRRKTSTDFSESLGRGDGTSSNKHSLLLLSRRQSLHQNINKTTANFENLNKYSLLNIKVLQNSYGREYFSSDEEYFLSLNTFNSSHLAPNDLITVNLHNAISTQHDERSIMSPFYHWAFICLFVRDFYCNSCKQWTLSVSLGCQQQANEQDMLKILHFCPKNTTKNGQKGPSFDQNCQYIENSAAHYFEVRIDCVPIPQKLHPRHNQSFQQNIDHNNTNNIHIYSSTNKLNTDIPTLAHPFQYTHPSLYLALNKVILLFSQHLTLSTSSQTDYNQFLPHLDKKGFTVQVLAKLLEITIPYEVTLLLSHLYGKQVRYLTRMRLNIDQFILYTIFNGYIYHPFSNLPEENDDIIDDFHNTSTYSPNTDKNHNHTNYHTLPSSNEPVKNVSMTRPICLNYDDKFISHNDDDFYLYTIFMSNHSYYVNNPTLKENTANQYLPNSGYSGSLPPFIWFIPLFQYLPLDIRAILRTPKTLLLQTRRTIVTSLEPLIPAPFAVSEILSTINDVTTTHSYAHPHLIVIGQPAPLTTKPTLVSPTLTLPPSQTPSQKSICKTDCADTNSTSHHLLSTQMVTDPMMIPSPASSVQSVISQGRNNHERVKCKDLSTYHHLLTAQQQQVNRQLLMHTVEYGHNTSTNLFNNPEIDDCYLQPHKNLNSALYQRGQRQNYEKQNVSVLLKDETARKKYEKEKRDLPYTNKSSYIKYTRQVQASLQSKRPPSVPSASPPKLPLLKRELSPTSQPTLNQPHFPDIMSNDSQSVNNLPHTLPTILSPHSNTLSKQNPPILPDNSTPPLNYTTIPNLPIPQTDPKQDTVSSFGDEGKYVIEWPSTVSHSLFRSIAKQLYGREKHYEIIISSVTEYILISPHPLLIHFRKVFLAHEEATNITSSVMKKQMNLEEGERLLTLKAVNDQNSSNSPQREKNNSEKKKNFRNSEKDELYMGGFHVHNPYNDLFSLQLIPTPLESIHIDSITGHNSSTPPLSFTPQQSYFHQNLRANALLPIKKYILSFTTLQIFHNCSDLIEYHRLINLFTQSPATPDNETSIITKEAYNKNLDKLINTHTLFNDITIFSIILLAITELYQIDLELYLPTPQIKQQIHKYLYFHNHLLTNPDQKEKEKSYNTATFHQLESISQKYPSFTAKNHDFFTLPLHSDQFNDIDRYIIDKSLLLSPFEPFFDISQLPSPISVIQPLAHCLPLNRFRATISLPATLQQLLIKSTQSNPSQQDHKNYFINKYSPVDENNSIFNAPLLIKNIAYQVQHDPYFTTYHQFLLTQIITELCLAILDHKDSGIKASFWFGKTVRQNGQKISKREKKSTSKNDNKSKKSSRYDSTQYNSQTSSLLSPEDLASIQNRRKRDSTEGAQFQSEIVEPIRALLHRTYAKSLLLGHENQFFLSRSMNQNLAGRIKSGNKSEINSHRHLFHASYTDIDEIRLQLFQHQQLLREKKHNKSLAKSEVPPTSNLTQVGPLSPASMTYYTTDVSKTDNISVFGLSRSRARAPAGTTKANISRARNTPNINQYDPFQSNSCSNPSQLHISHDISDTTRSPSNQPAKVDFHRLYLQNDTSTLPPTNLSQNNKDNPSNTIITSTAVQKREHYLDKLMSRHYSSSLQNSYGFDTSFISIDPNMSSIQQSEQEENAQNKNKKLKSVGLRNSPNNNTISSSMLLIKPECESIIPDCPIFRPNHNDPQSITSTQQPTLNLSNYDNNSKNNDTFNPLMNVNPKELLVILSRSTQLQQALRNRDKKASSSQLPHDDAVLSDDDDDNDDGDDNDAENSPTSSFERSISPIIQRRIRLPALSKSRGLVHSQSLIVSRSGSYTAYKPLINSTVQHLQAMRFNENLPLSEYISQLSTVTSAAVAAEKKRNLMNIPNKNTHHNFFCPIIDENSPSYKTTPKACVLMPQSSTHRPNKQVHPSIQGSTRSSKCSDNSVSTSLPHISNLTPSQFAQPPQLNDSTTRFTLVMPQLRQFIPLILKTLIHQHYPLVSPHQLINPLVDSARISNIIQTTAQSSFIRKSMYHSNKPIRLMLFTQEDLVPSNSHDPLNLGHQTPSDIIFCSLLNITDIHNISDQENGVESQCQSSDKTPSKRMNKNKFKVLQKEQTLYHQQPLATQIQQLTKINHIPFEVAPEDHISLNSSNIGAQKIQRFPQPSLLDTFSFKHDTKISTENHHCTEDTNTNMGDMSAVNNNHHAFFKTPDHTTPTLTADEKQLVLNSLLTLYANRRQKHRHIIVPIHGVYEVVIFAMQCYLNLLTYQDNQ